MNRFSFCGLLLISVVVVEVFSNEPNFKTCMRFRGQPTQDGVISSENANLPIDEWTFEAWVKVDPKQEGSGTIVAGNTDIGATKAFKAMTSKNGLLIIEDFYLAQEYQREKQETFSHPFHFAATLHSLSATHRLLQFYVNGSAVHATYYDSKQNNNTWFSAARDKWTIGSQVLKLSTGVGTSYVWSSFFVGWLDELRIWNQRRSHSQILSTMLLPLTGSEQGLQLYYSFDEGSGDVTKNQQVKGLNATLSNTNSTFDEMWSPSIIPTASQMGTLPSITQNPIRIQIFYNDTINGVETSNFRFSSPMMAISPSEIMFLLNGGAWIYNTAENRYSKMEGTVPLNRYAFSTAYINGKIYVYGGTDDPGDPKYSFNEVFEFSPATREWKLIDKNGDNRLFHLATNLGDEMLVVFGHLNYTTPVNTVRAFNTRTRVWRNVFTGGANPRFGPPILLPVMTRHERTVYHYGGLGLSMKPGPPFVPRTIMHTLNLDTMLWSILPVTGAAQWGIGAILFPVGRYLVQIGGMNVFASQLAAPAMFDTATNTWSDFPDQTMKGSKLAAVSQGSRAFIRSDPSYMYVVDTETCPIENQKYGVCTDSTPVCHEGFYGNGDCLKKKCRVACDFGEVCDENIGQCVPVKNDDSSFLSDNLGAIVGGVVAGASFLVLISVFIFKKRHKKMQQEAQERESQLVVKVDYKEIEMGRLIGQGSFGDVYVGRWRGADIAVKKLPIKTLSKEALKSFEDEVNVMVKLRHPNIVLYMGVCRDNQNLAILSELMTKGNLFEVIHNMDLDLDVGVKLNFLADAAKGMQYLHLSNPPILHRDLKSPNILLDNRWNAKISDFGLTIAQGTEEKNQQPPGTLLWMAPEVIDEKEYIAASDVYSYAIICWEVFERKQPYEGQDAVVVALQVLNSDLRLTFSENSDIPSDVKTMVEAAWQREPSKRPNFSDITRSFSSRIEESGFTASFVSLEAGTRSFKSGSGSHASRSSGPAAPSGDVALVFTDIQGSTALWESSPNAMADALILHNSIIRSCIKENKGYEVKTEGDAFMVSFGAIESALRFCLRVQELLLMSDWPEEILVTKEGCVLMEEGAMIFRGLRVRMGLHFGQPICNIDPLTKRMDYFGPVVNRAARVSGMAKGGQIVISEAVHQELLTDLSKFGEVNIRSLGEFQLKGIQTPENIYEVLPKQLAKRSIVFGVPKEAVLSIASPQNTVETDDGPEKKESQFAWEISPQDVKTDGGVLGEGSYGVVYLGEYKGQRVAVKRFLKQKLKERSYYNILSEVLIMASVNHKNILKIAGACLQRQNMMIVLEYAPYGSLYKVLRDPKVKLQDPDRLQIALQVAEGMQYLHARTPPICHRDLKSGNILIVSLNPIDVRISDFGLARIKAENQTMTKCGTKAWLAPEVLRGERYSEKADLFSYGILCWEIVMGDLPYRNIDPLRICAEVLKGMRPNVPKSGPLPLITVMQKCWDAQPQNRPSFDSVYRTLKG